MRRLLVLPFATASSRLEPADERRLNELLQTAEMSAFREDLTCIFVLLGFADMRGEKFTISSFQASGRARCEN